MTKISAIIAVLNYDNNCKLSIDSILNSKVSKSNLIKEIIIVLGNLNQKEQILNDYLVRKNNPVSLKIVGSKQGIYPAYNKGLEYATGDYLLFMGGGEELNYNECFYKKITTAINLKLDAYIFNISFNNKQRIKKLNVSDLKCPPHQTIIYSNKLIKKINLTYDEKLKIYSDAIFTKSFLKNVESFMFLSFALVDFKEGGLGNSIKGINLRLLDQLKIFFIYRKNMQGFLSLIKYLLREINFLRRNIKKFL